MGELSDLTVFKKAFALSMQIFEVSKKFPPEEKYSLTDQIRRSSRSVCANLAESYRKRMYKAHFILKVSDADAENMETQIWLQFAFSCKYLDDKKYRQFLDVSQEVGRMLHHMISYPEKYGVQNRIK
jgi:four helix bundle protein